MVFSSVPAYLDPSNWQQQQAHQIIGNSSGNHHLLPPPPPPQSAAAAPPPLQPHGGGVGSIRPGSMSERARMANIPMPETALKCPRCESTNTKFCYFNNYSLTQPRHFCKTCRRYWTRGGALRNVPVGGGCRRNKRSTKSSSNSKSSPASGDRQTSATSTSTISTNSGGGAGSLFGHPPQLPPLRFMSPLSQLTENFTSDMGLNYSGGANEMNFHGGSNLLGGASLFTGGGAGIEPWRFQQFPFLNGGSLDPSPPAGINYQFHGGESGFLGSESRPKMSNSLLSQLASVKMEESREMNLSRQLAGGGMNTANDHQWNNNVNNAAWTDLSSFSSSSTSNQL